MRTCALPDFWPLRIRVSMSAMGSVMLISESLPCLSRAYQLALRSPGISPRIVLSRSLLRPRPNLR